MLRRRRGSVSTPRSGPSLFGLLVLGSPRPGGQPKSQKAFWAACLDLGSFRRAAPRAIGSRSRVGLLARVSAAVSGGGRRRGSFGRVPAAFVWWAPHPPAVRGPEKPLSWRRRVPLCVARGRRECFDSRLVCLQQKMLQGTEVLSKAIGTLASHLRHKKTHREQADTSLHHQPTAL